LNDRRVLLLQVAYDHSNLVHNNFIDCINLLFEHCNEKGKSNEGEAIDEIKDKIVTQISALWTESTASLAPCFARVTIVI